MAVSIVQNLDTPYYTAPSTNVRPTWRESTEVIPSSSQRQIDSGLGKTITDQSQGNSQSQIPRDGPVIGSGPTSQTADSKRAIKHTSFEDEKRVLAYDTDATEGEEKVGATDKKSAKTVCSSKKSTRKKKGVSSKHHKYRSRGRSAKSSRSRSGNKKSDSDSESQSGDNDDKRRKGQSSSGTRPWQSRSKQRRASRSRSASCLLYTS